MAKVLAVLRNRIGWIQIVLFSTLSIAFIGLLAAYLFLPMGPMCIGTIDQCAYALSQPTKPPILEGSLLNWLLIIGGSLILNFSVMAYGAISDRSRTPSGIATS